MRKVCLCNHFFVEMQISHRIYWHSLSPLESGWIVDVDRVLARIKRGNVSMGLSQFTQEYNLTIL